MSDLVREGYWPAASAPPRGCATLGILGWTLTVSWVALGLSYTLFDNYLISFSALRGEFRFYHLVMLILMLWVRWAKPPSPKGHVASCLFGRNVSYPAHQPAAA
jgi:hypothetical protein